MRTGTTGYMSRRFKVLSVDDRDQYWLPDLERLLSRGYNIARVERLQQGNKRGEAIIFILENPQVAFGVQTD